MAKSTGCQKHGKTNCIECKTARGAKTVSHRRTENKKKTTTTEKENDMTKTNKTAKTEKTAKTPKTPKTPKGTAKVEPTPAPTSTMDDHAPNARWPYGVKLTTPTGVQYERLSNAATRDRRVNMLISQFAASKLAEDLSTKVEPVDYNPAATPAPTATPIVEVTRVAKVKGGKVKVTRVAKVKTAKPAKVKTPKTPKEPKVAGDPIVKLLAKGVFYFTKSATGLLNGLPFVQVVVTKNKVTMTPAKTAADGALEVRHSQIGVSKLLKDTTWNKATQDLTAKVAGDSFVVEVR